MVEMKQVKKRSKRTQITIFVILALVIIAVLLVIFYPSISKAWINPTIGEMIPKDCVEKVVRAELNMTMTHGGEVKPLLYFNYKNQSIAYVCYTSEWYKTCVMQKPFLKQDIEKEVLKYSSDKVKSCYEGMIQNMKNRGYVVEVSGDKKVDISLEPKKIVVSTNINLILEKNDVKTTLDSDQLQIKLNSNAYDMIMIASSIQNFEARYGDSTPEDYMIFYPNIKVQKLKQSDGTKVYIINDRNTGEVLQFATRSLAWPPGFALPLQAQENNGVSA
jgi:hypothetical protein